MACTETARIAQLVARQRSSKRKTGRQVNCQMRVKKTMPFFLEGKVFSHAKIFKPVYKYIVVGNYGNIAYIHDKHLYLLAFIFQEGNIQASTVFPFESN